MRHDATGNVPSRWVGPDLEAADYWRFPAPASVSRALLRDGSRPEQPPSVVDFAGRVRQALHPDHGPGLALVSGLPVSPAEPDKGVRVAYALARAIGVLVSQNAAQEYVAHVRSTGATYSTSERRGYLSDAELRFHADFAHVAALVCLADAASGGDSLVVSVGEVLATLEQESPSLVEVLRQPFPQSRLDEEGPNEAPYVTHPVLCSPPGTTPLLFFNPTLVDAAVTHDGAPPLSQEQCKALQAITAIADRPNMELRLHLLPGDALLLNNYLVLHSRTAFSDAPPPAPRRHLLRVWMNCTDLFPSTADLFEFRYGNLGVPEHA